MKGQRTYRLFAGEFVFCCLCMSVALLHLLQVGCNFVVFVTLSRLWELLIHHECDFFTHQHNDTAKGTLRMSLSVLKLNTSG